MNGVPAHTVVLWGFLAGDTEGTGVILWVSCRNNTAQGSLWRSLALVCRENIEGMSFLQELLSPQGHRGKEGQRRIGLGWEGAGFEAWEFEEMGTQGQACLCLSPWASEDPSAFDDENGHSSYMKPSTGQKEALRSSTGTTSYSDH